MEIHKNLVTAVIGPSGCGKSTFIRCLNRMNDLIPGFTAEGEVLYHGVDLQSATVDPVAVRRRIGMVFQRPNPFPKSIYDNIAFGLRVLGMKDSPDERVDRSGVLVEYDATQKIFTSPAEQRTEDYVTGRFG